MDINFEEMMKNVKNAGGLFYQYRPCRRDVEIIYDIENIRHGVVYAQTPLNMNDPFDSMIGYSPDKIYENCISMIVNAVKMDDNTRIILEQILRYRSMGKFAEVLICLNNIKRYILKRRVLMHQFNTPLKDFVQKNQDVLFSKYCHSTENCLSREVFHVFALIASKMDIGIITEQTLSSFLHMDEHLEELHNIAIDVKDKTYLPNIKKFISKLTVSCFSTSGWDNQLMWSHYANSYAGICIEYDFSKIEQFVGFINPVEYVAHRQTVSLEDIGIKCITTDTDIYFNYSEPNMEAIFTLLLEKNKCWEYEKEWRIINIGEENTPRFVNLPYVRSITFGINIDPVCKRLLYDVCQEKGIECFEIVTDNENFSLSREPLIQEKFVYDMDKEVEYITILMQQITSISDQMITRSGVFTDKDENINITLLRPMIVDYLDALTNAYFLKVSLNRLCENSEEGVSQESVPSEIIELVAQFKVFLCQIKIATDSIHDSLSILRLGGALNSTEYKEMNKLLCDLKELAEKFENIDWNPVFLAAKEDDYYRLRDHVGN